MNDGAKYAVVTGAELFEGAPKYPEAETPGDEPQKKGTAGTDSQSRRTKGEDEE